MEGSSCWSFQEFDRHCFSPTQLSSPDVLERRLGMFPGYRFMGEGEMKKERKIKYPIM